MAANSSDPVRVIRNVLIPMPDGVELAADLFLPAAEGTYPAVLNFLPYHKDGRGGRDTFEVMNRHFAARGYAALTLDFRGLGGSEGENQFPFDPQERADGYQAVEWIAAQPWCDGNVGMWGVSYGGITSLSVASTRPPHLKAIVPIHACTDIYEDFLRLGGCRGGFWSEADWGSRMTAYNLLPPLYQDEAGRWARVWQEHLDNARPWILSWHEHPEHDQFWDSRVIPYQNIQAATFAVCGWQDFYVPATIRYYTGIAAPKRLVMGPWKHAFPDVSMAEPIGMMHEMDRWWDRWLKGQDNGVEAEPPVSIFVQGANTWRHETDWPPARTQTRELYLAPSGSLQEAEVPGEAQPAVWQHDPTAGIYSVIWDPWTGNVPSPQDQSDDDHRSLTFDTAPLPGDTEVTGTPELELFVASSIDAPNLVAKLCDVAPNGSSALVSMAWLDGCRHTSAEQPSPMTPGKVFAVKLALRPTSHVFKAGHRLRIAISGADFPRIWPVPRAFDLAVHHSALCPSRLLLPLLPAPEPALPAPALEPPAPGLHSSVLLDSQQRWSIRRDLAPAGAALENVKDDLFRLDERTTMRIYHRYSMAVEQGEPQSTGVRVETRVDITRPVNPVVVECETMESAHRLHITARITMDGQPIFNRAWELRA